MARHPLTVFSFAVSISFLGAMLPLGNVALAQIIPDATLGTERSHLTPHVRIRGDWADQIDGGAARGVNLFHSFEQFNVGAGQRVYFANPVGIENILSRVTGTDISNIRGTLGVNGSANLFLLNPNGIIFAPHAQLDIRGSFLASTADGFTFPNGSSFSATNPTGAPLLRVNVPIGLQYGNSDNGTIRNRGNLAVGQDFTLAADVLNLQGQLQAGQDLHLVAEDTLVVRDRPTTPFTATAGDRMVVQGNEAVDIFAVNHPSSGFFSSGDMVLRSANTIGGDAHYWSGGNFLIETLSNQLGQLESPYDPVIRASGDVSFDSYSGASLHILAGGSVFIPGGITITGVDTVANSLQETVTLAGGITVPIDGSAVPTVDIRAGTTAFAPIGRTPEPPPGFSPAPPAVNAAATGANITIGEIRNESGSATNEGQVLLTNQYSPNALTPGAIRTGLISTFGDVLIYSRGDIETTGNIDTRTVVDGQVAGSINLLAPTGGITLGGDLFSNVGTGTDPTVAPTITGVGGNITLFARDDILTRDHDIIATSNNSTLDDALSTIFIESSQGSVILNNVQITARNFGADQFAGDIFIDASDTIEITNDSSIAADGNFGRIFIGANTFPPSDDSTVPLAVVIRNSTLTATNNSINGAQDAGAIIVRGGLVRLSDRAFLITDTYGEGDGGNVGIQAQALIITGGAEALTRTFGAGAGGDILVIPLNPDLPSLVRISGIAPFTELDINGDPDGGYSSGLFATTEDDATGRGGTINVTTDTLRVQNGGVLSARTRSTADSGGDNGQAIVLDLERLLVTGGGQILSAAFDRGAAGDIQINASNRVIIRGIDPNFETRFAELFNAFLDAGLTQDEAFRRTQQTIDPVNSVSALEASDVFGLGSAGDITVESPLVVLSDLGQINATTRGDRRGGDITVRSQNLFLLGGSEILTLTVGGSGRAGDITLEPLNANAPSSVTISGTAPAVLPDGTVGGFSSGLFASTETFPDATVETTGRGGNIRVTTGTLRMNDGAVIGVRSRSTGAGGTVRVNVDDLFMSGGGQLLTTAFNTGVAGNIRVRATGQIRISESDLTFGDRVQQVTDAILSQPGNTLTRDEAEENARAIIDQIGSSLYPDFAPSGLQARSELDNGPSSGNIFARANSITISNGAEISVSSFGAVGLTSGVIDLRAGDRIYVTGERSRISSDTFGRADAGLVSLLARSVVLDNLAQVSSSTFRQGLAGNAGGVLLTAQNLVSLSGTAAVFTTVENGARGNAGLILVTAPLVELTDNAELQTQVNPGGRGIAGNVLVFASDRISLDNSRIFSNIESGASGRGGFILLTTPFLSMTNGAQLQTQVNGIDLRDFNDPNDDLAAGIGNAGNVFLDVSGDIVLDSDSSIFSSMGFGTTGRGGTLFAGDLLFSETFEFQGIERSRSLSVTNGAQFIASTAGQGDAGDVYLFADDVLFDGVSDSGFPSAVFSGVDLGGTGRGGSIALSSNSLNIFNGALLTVSSFGRGDIGGESDVEQLQEAGNIRIESPSIRLEDEGQIIARTGIGSGGNISLGNIDDVLLLRGASRISTTAGTFRARGDGGNIFIRGSEGFVIGEPSGNDDITSDAFLGRGGFIQINAQAIVGMLFRSREDIERLLGEDAFQDPDPTSQLETSDITAISQSDPSLNGEVRINAANFDVRGALSLPANLADASNLIAQNCPTGDEAGEDLGSFTVTGRGGLPQNPTNVLGSDNGVTEWVSDEAPPDDASDEATPAPTDDQVNATLPEIAHSSPAGSTTQPQMVEAQGWVVSAQGQIELVAQTAPEGVSTPAIAPPAVCPIPD
jgi:filamentous hemagglutinin family protein